MSICYIFRGVNLASRSYITPFIYSYLKSKTIKCNYVKGVPLASIQPADLARRAAISAERDKITADIY